MINHKCPVLLLMAVFMWCLVWGCVTGPAVEFTEVKPSETIPLEEEAESSPPENKPAISHEEKAETSLAEKKSAIDDATARERAWQARRKKLGLPEQKPSQSEAESTSIEPALTERQEEHKEPGPQTTSKNRKDRKDKKDKNDKVENTKKTRFEASLKDIKVGTLDFNKEKLPNVLKVISAMTGVNFTIEKDIFPSKPGEKVDDNVNKLMDVEVTFYYKNINLLSLLEILCEQYGLAYRVHEDYIRIIDKRDEFSMSLADAEKVSPDDNITMSDGIIKRLDLKGMPLFKALRVFSEMTGKNVMCKDDEKIKFRPVNLVLKDIPVMTAIEAICKQLNLWYKEDKENNYVCLMGASDFGKDAPVDYQVKTRVFNLKYASAPQLADSIACVMGDRVEYTLPSNLRSYEHLKLPDLEQEEGEIEEATKSEAKITKEIEAPKIKDEYLTADNIEGLMGTKLDLMLTAQDLRMFNKTIGFALMTIFLRNNSIIACSTDDTILDEIAALIHDLDTATPQVLIECRILSVNLTDDFTSFFQVSDLEYVGEGEKSFGDTEQLFNIPQFGGAPTGIGAGAEMLYNFIGNRWKFDVAVELLKKDGFVNIVATPMIVAAQNTEAEAKVGLANVPFFKNVTTVAPVVPSEGSTVIPGYSVPEYETADLVGTELRITPQINENGSVTLRIYMEQSSIEKKAAKIWYNTFDQTTGAPGDWREQEVDVLGKNTLSTIAVVPKDQTLALGGLVNEHEEVRESKVPLLGDIPVLGFFFKDHYVVKERKETVILLTPHIMMCPEEAGEATEEALKGFQHPSVKDGKKDLFELDEQTQKLKRVE